MQPFWSDRPQRGIINDAHSPGNILASYLEPPGYMRKSTPLLRPGFRKFQTTQIISYHLYSRNTTERQNSYSTRVRKMIWIMNFRNLSFSKFLKIRIQRINQRKGWIGLEWTPGFNSLRHKYLLECLNIFKCFFFRILLISISNISLFWDTTVFPQNVGSAAHTRPRFREKNDHISWNTWDVPIKFYTFFTQRNILRLFVHNSIDF